MPPDGGQEMGSATSPRNGHPRRLGHRQSWHQSPAGTGDDYNHHGANARHHAFVDKSDTTDGAVIVVSICAPCTRRRPVTEGIRTVNGNRIGKKAKAFPLDSALYTTQRAGQRVAESFLFVGLTTSCRRSTGIMSPVSPSPQTSGRKLGGLMTQFVETNRKRRDLQTDVLDVKARLLYAR